MVEAVEEESTTVSSLASPSPHDQDNEEVGHTDV